MAAATSNVSQMYELAGASLIDVEATEIIYMGTPASLNGSGYARALTAGDIYAGWNRKGQIDNSAGAAGAESVEVQRDILVRLTVAGIVSEQDRGKFVYATDDTTFTIAPGVPGASTCIGKVSRYLSAGKALVHAYVGADEDEEAFVASAVPAQDATAANVTYTMAQLLTGFVRRDPGAARSDVTPTAVLIVAALKNARVGSKFEFVVQNDGGAGETITVTAGAGVTVEGTATIATANSKRFLAEVTNITSGAEAVNVFSLGTVVF